MTPHRKKIAPLVILLTILGFIGFLAWSALQAGTPGTRITDAAYYSKGLKYNTTQVEKRAAEVLGWTLEAVLQDRVLEVRLVDSSGGAVTGATGTVYLAVPGEEGNVHLPLEEAGEGSYRVVIGESVRGGVQARLAMERDGARINRLLLLNL